MDWQRLYEVLAAYYFGCYITRADRNGNPLWANWTVSLFMGALWPLAEAIGFGIDLQEKRRLRQTRKSER